EAAVPGDRHQLRGAGDRVRLRNVHVGGSARPAYAAWRPGDGGRETAAGGHPAGAAAAAGGGRRAHGGRHLVHALPRRPRARPGRRARVLAAGPRGGEGVRGGRLRADAGRAVRVHLRPPRPPAGRHLQARGHADGGAAVRARVRRRLRRAAGAGAARAAAGVRPAHRRAGVHHRRQEPAAAHAGRAPRRARAGAERALVRPAAPHALQRGRSGRGRTAGGCRAHLPDAHEPPRLARRAGSAASRRRLRGVRWARGGRL
ncbi:MAG: Metal-dependent hydrolases of the beta-lactamase superfamily I; PhnP protein, partial [uncultured Gemmatimonadetes bacterium]